MAVRGRPSSTWDPEVLSRIQNLRMQAQEAVEGLLHGAHRSVRTANNVEFAEHKEYTPGDPIRDLDWRVLARSDRLVLRRHEAEHELPIHLVVDASGDMGTGAGGQYESGTKWEMAVVAAATLAEWASRRGDPVGLSVVAGRDVKERWLPPRTGRPQLAQIYSVLAHTRPEGQADLSAALSQLGSRARRRSMVVLLSDLMEEPSIWAPAMHGFRARRIDMRVLHLYDSREWSLGYGSSFQFFSPEGGAALPVDPGVARQAFGQVVEAYLTEVRHILRTRGARHVLAATDAPLPDALWALLSGG